MRVEELNSKVEGSFAELEARLAELRSPAADDVDEWGELLDAVDMLEQAARHAEADRELAAGLAGVVAKLERFLARVGLERRAAEGERPDGRLFRVVGAEPSAALPDGVVARVVRAAVLRGDEILREGEVIVTRRSA
jgi:molecular chaperone GrpE (heat shock protein)